MSYTQDLKNRGMNRLAAERENKAPWLQAATDASARTAYAQQMADQRSAEAELGRVRSVLMSKQTFKYRWRLRNKGVDIDQLSPAALLVAIMKEVDEVTNDAN